MKVRKLLTQLLDVFLLQPLWQALFYLYWTEKHHPGINDVVLEAVKEQLITFHQRTREKIFVPHWQVIAEHIDDRVVFHKVLIFAKVGEFSNDIIAIL